MASLEKLTAQAIAETCDVLTMHMHRVEAKIQQYKAAADWGKVERCMKYRTSLQRAQLITVSVSRSLRDNGIISDEEVRQFLGALSFEHTIGDVEVLNRELERFLESL